MSTLTFPSGRRTVHALPLTLRNADTLSKWVETIKAHIKRTNKAGQVQLFVDLMAKHPELQTLMDMDGGWNRAEVERRLGEWRKQHERATEETGEVTEFNEAEYRERVEKEMQRDLQNTINDTPVIAKMLHFAAPRFPEDLESLKLGIDCIKACAVPTDLDGLADDDWFEVSAAEVAEWVTQFHRSHS